MTTNPTRSKNYARVLTLLLGLFALRVVTQLLVLNFDVPLLPSLDEPVVAHQTLFHDARRPSQLILPMVPLKTADETGKSR